MLLPQLLYATVHVMEEFSVCTKSPHLGWIKQWKMKGQLAQSTRRDKLSVFFYFMHLLVHHLQCFDAVGWVTGRASGTGL